MTRRRFMKTGAAATAALAIPASLDALLAGVAEGARLETRGFGPLRKDPAGLLDLPVGFSYRTLSTSVLGRIDDPRFTQHLTTQEVVPALHDGMGAFAGSTEITILVRNHELEPGHFPRVDDARVRPYDPLGTGGTTTLWLDAEARLLRSFPSLSGTFANCAGGVTPWGSWLSCEECTYMPGEADPVNHDRTPLVERRHGYVFEVDAHAEGLVDPRPIRPMGRFNHEAVAVDPATGFVYLSEDRDDGLFYRYRPDVVVNRAKRSPRLAPGDLEKGGTLEALRFIGKPSATTQNWESEQFFIGPRYRIDWVRIPNADPDMDQERDPDDPADPVERRGRTAPTSTRAQGFRLGAAQFARSEGILYHRGGIHLCCTNGGRAHAGQVWRLDLKNQELALAIEPNQPALLDGPDNLAAAPNGDFIVCEDGGNENFVLGLTPRGQFYRLARNALNHSKLAGACFSPDGTFLFVNFQDPGITFAISGPWERRA